MFYVAPFYLSATLRSTPFHSRDAPTVIRARVRAVGLTCLVCTVVTVYILALHGNASPREVVRLLGLWPIDPLDVLKVLALVMILFACSLYELVLVDGEWRHWSFAAFKEAVFDDWIGYRNLVVAPLSEEVVFRSLAIPLFLLANVDQTRIVFVTPLVFGLAHLHHLVDFLQARTPKGRLLPPVAAWIQGICRSLFQFTYTSLFGFFAAFVFLRTGNLWAAVLAHTFCNHIGIPRLWGRVGQFADYDYIPSELKQGNSTESSGGNGTVKVGSGLQTKDESTGTSAGPARLRNLGLAWTIVYYAFIPAGAYGFYRLLFPLTESQFSLVKF